MAKIKITKEQAIMLENLNKKKVIKITESQYKKLIESLNPGKEIDKAFNNAIPSEPHGLETQFNTYRKELSEDVKKNMWESFVNELYGLNESSEKMYETLIKLMEACGYVENRKLSKTKFGGNKEKAKNVILGGLQTLHETGSPFMAMESMEDEFERTRQHIKNQLIQTAKTKPSEQQISDKLAQLKKAEEERRKASGEIKEIDGEENPEIPTKMVPVSSEIEDEIDTITMDVPLFIRALEYSREDAKSDMDLHDIAQNAVALGKDYGVLNMDNYSEIFGNAEEVEVQPTGEESINEIDGKNEYVGYDILKVKPFSDLPNTRGENGDGITSPRKTVTLPDVSGNGLETLYSKQDFYDHKVQGPKMVHEFSGYIERFKSANNGEEPIFYDIYPKTTDINIPNAKIKQFEENPENIEKRERYISMRKSQASSDREKGYGMDETELDEVTDMGGAGGVFGGDGVNPKSGGSTFPVAPLGYKVKEIKEALDNLKKKVTDESEEELEESTTTVSAGPFGYATRGFAPSEFMGTSGKKGKAPVNIKKKTPIWPGGSFVEESAFDKTQWADGAFVEFDDCTKLNNNKEAQNGGCSTGAVDGVVKLKKTATNVNAPSLGK